MEICLEREETGLGFAANVEMCEHSSVEPFYLNITSTIMVRKQ